MHNAIGNARHNKERIRLLETFIEKCYLKKDQAMLPVFKSIQLIIEKRELVKIADLPPAACLSERRLKDNSSAIQFYPKQAHFINDFREFSGIYPKSFFSGKSGITVWRDVLASFR